MPTKLTINQARLAEISQHRLDAEQAEFNLRLNASLFYALMQQAPLGVYVVDDQFRLQQVNAHAAPSFAKVDSPIGRDFSEIMRTLWGEQVGSEISDIFRHTLATGERFVSPRFTNLREDLNEKKSYSWETQRVMLPSGRFGVVCYFSDITEQVQAEQALIGSEQRTRLATQATGVGIWEWNVRTGQLRWDPHVFRIYGVPATADGLVTYETWRERVLPEDLPRQEELIQGIVQKGTQLSSREFRIRRLSDSEIRYIQAVETARADREGKTEWIIGTNLDITERHFAETALREAKTAAEQASRAKDKFLATLSHELRTPIMPVLITAESMKEDTTLPLPVREQFEMIERNIALEARLLEDLLDVTAATQGKLKLRQVSIDAHNLIQLAVEIVRDEAAGKNIHITHELAAEQSVLGIADPARIQQVIWNLLNNAVKYTPPAGRVKIRTLNRQTDDGCNWLRVEVSDTGMGIRPELLEIIFDPFEQAVSPAKHRFGGLGLGLSIARAIVQLHKGRIWAESDGPAQGSSFIVELPGAVAARPETAEELTVGERPRAVVPVARNSPNIQRLLLVEDHQATLHTLAALLTRSGYEVVTAESAAEALLVAANEKIDLVVSDLGLPDGTGIQLMEELRSRHGLKGVALSGYGMEEDIARAREAGFVAHLVKPVRIADLRAVLAAQ